MTIPAATATNDHDTAFRAVSIGRSRPGIVSSTGVPSLRVPWPSRSRTDRRSPVVGIVWSIAILIAYILLINGFITLGKHNRMSPFLSVIVMEVVFGVIGLHLLATNNGWWWQLLETGKRWKAQWAEGEEGKE